MNDILGQDAALQGYTELGTNWANVMNFWYDSCPRCKINQLTCSPAV